MGHLSIIVTDYNTQKDSAVGRHAGMSLKRDCFQEMRTISIHIIILVVNQAPAEQASEFDTKLSLSHVPNRSIYLEKINKEHPMSKSVG